MPIPQRIAVVGDIMHDLRRYGRSSRASPEDPNCRVLAHLSQVSELGGAANVAYWLAAQLDTEVSLFGHWGMDEDGFALRMLCRRSGIHLCDLLLRRRGDYHTTRKERICLVDRDDQQIDQLVRCDHDTNCVMSEIECKLLQRELAENFDLLVVADYNKGMFTGEAGERLIRWIGNPRQMPVIVNSKLAAAWDRFPLDTLICNEKEALQNWGSSADIFDYAHVRARNLVITRGPMGVSWQAQEGSEAGRRCHGWQPAPGREVHDVTGAGDAFTAGYAWEYLRRPQLADHALPAESEIKACIGQGQQWAARCIQQIGCGQPLVMAPAAHELTEGSNNAMSKHRMEIG